MSIHRTIRLEQPRKRLELEVRIEKHETHEGCLDTDLQPVHEPHNRLSISMGQWVRRGPRSPWRENCFGQSRERVLAFAKDCSPEVRSAIERLCELWAEWHLNDMKAGTDKQMQAIEEAKTAGEITNADWYGTACVALSKRGLREDRGYSFGSKWLVKRLPTHVVSEVLALCERLMK